MLVDNDTLYNLTVYLSGPASRVIKVAPKSTQTVPLEAGHYEVAAKVSNSAVVPFYGVADYGPDIQYSEKFYIQTRVH
jgi:P pilus assembly chaperone PapD